MIHNSTGRSSLVKGRKIFLADSYIYIITRLVCTLVPRQPTSQPSLPYITVSNTYTPCTLEQCSYVHCRTQYKSANVMVIVFVYASILQTLLFRTLYTNAAVTITCFPNAAVTSIVLSDAADIAELKRCYREHWTKFESN